MTDFNNPQERKAWEESIYEMGKDDKEPMNDKDDKYLWDKFHGEELKEYRYGWFDDIIVTMYPEKHGVLYNTVTGQRWLYIGQDELNVMFMMAKQKSQRYNALNKALM